MFGIDSKLYNPTMGFIHLFLYLSLSISYGEDSQISTRDQKTFASHYTCEL